MNIELMDLLAIRIKSFATEFGLMVVMAIIAVFQSPEFSDLMVKHFGEVWGAGVGLLLVKGLVAHLLNLKAIHDYNKVGSDDDEESAPLVLI